MPKAHEGRSADHHGSSDASHPAVTNSTAWQACGLDHDRSGCGRAAALVVRDPRVQDHLAHPVHIGAELAQDARTSSRTSTVSSPTPSRRRWRCARPDLRSVFQQVLAEWRLLCLTTQRLK